MDYMIEKEDFFYKSCEEEEEEILYEVNHELQDAIQRMIQKRFRGNMNGGRGIKTSNINSIASRRVLDESSNKNTIDKKCKDTNIDKGKNKRIDYLKNQENFGERKRIKP